MVTTERLEMVEVGSLVGYARNARTHSQEQVQKLRSSLREFGFVNPILCDAKLNIIAGHGRVLAAKAEGIEKVPCVFVEHLTEAQKRAYILADNRLALDAGWDEEMLALEFADLQEQGFGIDVTGFGASEVERALGAAPEVDDDLFDLDTAMKEASFVEPGDVWELGRHRLMCGDSTDSAAFSALTGGRKANLVLTDPPYGVDYQSPYGNPMGIKGDKASDEDLLFVMREALANCAASLAQGGSAYVFHAASASETVFRAFREAGFKIGNVCVWAKNHHVLGRTPFHYKHEPILYGWLANGKHDWFSDRKQTTLWEFSKPNRSVEHPTMKPLDLLAYPIGISTQPNGVVLDPFGGSGSTMMACEKTGRECLTMEIDAKYASAADRRYASEFGGDAVSCRRDGKSARYSELAKEPDIPDRFRMGKKHAR
jgi:DNA modification methylase